MKLVTFYVTFDVTLNANFDITFDVPFDVNFYVTFDVTFESLLCHFFVICVRYHVFGVRCQLSGDHKEVTR